MFFKLLPCLQSSFQKFAELLSKTHQFWWRDSGISTNLKWKIKNLQKQNEFTFSYLILGMKHFNCPLWNLYVIFDSIWFNSYIGLPSVRTSRTSSCCEDRFCALSTCSERAPRPKTAHARSASRLFAQVSKRVVETLQLALPNNAGNREGCSR